MIMRYEDVDSSVTKVLDEVRATWFKELNEAKIKCVFDTKIRKSKGKVVLACIRKTNDLLRHLTAEEAQDELGYDYIIAIDKVVWNAIQPEDRVRLIRHELNHAFVVEDAETEDPYKIVDHDFSDFKIEVERNKDNPNWAERAVTLAEDIYDQMKEQEKEAKGAGKKKRGHALRRMGRR
jgi:hypothetical protein